MSRSVFGVAAALLMMTAPTGAEQESIAAARDLYASAAYEDALAVLNKLPSAGRPAEEARSIEQYRAFCLLALGRTAEAEHAIESVVAAEPAYRPTNDLSPRGRNAFADVRRRVLPSIIQQKYAQARAAFDRKDFAVAAAGFAETLDTMNDPDVASAISQPPLSDLRTLALGFKDLAATAAAPPPPPPVATAPPAAPVEEPTPAAPKVPKIYSATDREVTPPAVLRQDLPPYPGQVFLPRQGVLEVVIDESGMVETALMRVAVANNYDPLALAATRSWRYRPAMLNGTPVKYRKAVQVTLRPTGR
jgi:tetratricopeptide (TPR) repeat protein